MNLNTAKIAQYRPTNRTSEPHQMWTNMVQIVALNAVPMRWSEQFEHACRHGGSWPKD